MDNFTIGNRIKYERERMGLNQLELGKMVGVSKQCVSGWETGRRTPDVITLNELAKLFEIEMVSFLYDNSECTGTDKKQIQISPKLTDNELLIISRLRALPSEYRKAVELLLQIKDKK